MKSGVVYGIVSCYQLYVPTFSVHHNISYQHECYVQCTSTNACSCLYHLQLKESQVL